MAQWSRSAWLFSAALLACSAHAPAPQAVTPPPASSGSEPAKPPAPAREAHPKPAGAKYVLARSGESLTLDGEPMGELRDRPFKIEPLFTVLKERSRDAGGQRLSMDVTFLDFDDAAERRVWLSAAVTLTYALHPRLVVASGAELALAPIEVSSREPPPRSKVGVALFQDVAFVAPLRLLSGDAEAAKQVRVPLTGSRTAAVAALADAIARACKDEAASGETVVAETGEELAFGALALFVDAVAQARSSCGLSALIQPEALKPGAREAFLEAAELEAHPERAKFWCSYVYATPDVSFCETSENECRDDRSHRSEPGSPLSPCEPASMAHCFVIARKNGQRDRVCLRDAAGCASFSEFLRSRGETIASPCAEQH